MRSSIYPQRSPKAQDQERSADGYDELLPKSKATATVHFLYFPRLTHCPMHHHKSPHEIDKIANECLRLWIPIVSSAPLWTNPDCITGQERARRGWMGGWVRRKTRKEGSEDKQETTDLRRTGEGEAEKTEEETEASRRWHDSWEVDEDAAAAVAMGTDDDAAGVCSNMTTLLAQWENAAIKRARRSESNASKAFVRAPSVCLSVLSVRARVRSKPFPFLSFPFLCFPSSRRWKEKPGWKGRLRAQSGNVWVLLVRHWGAAKQSARWDERTVLCGTPALFPCAPIAVPHAPHEIRPRPNNGGFSPRPTADEWMNYWMDDKWLDGWMNEWMDGMLYRDPSIEVW
jgi:hypothetical protein